MSNGTKGLQFAADLTKQIITLSTGLMALTMTFADKLGSKVDEVVQIPWSLKIAWLFFGAALVGAVWTLMAITGTLSVLDRGKADPNPERTNIKIPARLMLGSFCIAILLVFITGLSVWW